LIFCEVINPDGPVKSLYSVSFRKFRVDSIAFAGGTPVLPGLFAASSFLIDRIAGIVWVNRFGGLGKGIFLSG